MSRRGFHREGSQVAGWGKKESETGKNELLDRKGAKKDVHRNLKHKAYKQKKGGPFKGGGGRTGDKGKHRGEKIDAFCQKKKKGGAHTYITKTQQGGRNLSPSERGGVLSKNAPKREKISQHKDRKKPLFH